MNQPDSSDLPDFIKTDEPVSSAIIRQAESSHPPAPQHAAAPARPGHFAEREELDAALKAGTPEALRLFLDRHPDSRYRGEALEALRRLPSPPSR